MKSGLGLLAEFLAGVTVLGVGALCLYAAFWGSNAPARFPLFVLGAVTPIVVGVGVWLIVGSVRDLSRLKRPGAVGGDQR
jgi:hypothetical protein